MKETFSKDSIKGTEHTIFLMVLNVKHSGKITKVKGIEYLHTMMVLHKKEKIKMAKIMVIINMRTV